MKNPSADYIDKIISAKIPDLNVDSDGYNAVNKFMIHGPCGKHNSHSPCMMQDKCTKHFPKKFNDQTTVDTNGFIVYKRRNTGIHVEKKGVFLDNRYVVPYHRNLIVKFDAHINIEICNYSRSVKYLFKYVHKGSDRTTATMESIDTTQEMDEIKTYLDYRYISATEACWRIFQFDIHYRKPAVERLPFHLLGEHTVIFKESKCLQNVLTIPGIEKTKFTEWLEANKIYDDVRELTYSDFPTCWVSDASQLWKSNYTTLSEDITSLQRKRFRLKDLQLTEQQVEAYTLLEIETIMLKMGKSLRDIDGMPLPNSSLIRDSGNRLVNEELDYDRDQLKKLHEKSFAALNACQKSAYEAIMHSVENEKGHLFFINGHGGIGKTFLWNTIIAKLISHSKIVLPVATSDVTEESTCEIRQGTLLAGLLMKTSLIIWDEAPIAHKLCFEALDRTLRDILRTSLKFNGIPNHDIRFKEGAPVMLLRNLNQIEGICNGKRLIVTCLGKWSIRGDIISRTNIGQNVTIPRIIMSPNESR
ncbi:helitron like n domain-containing protein [Citrus sinensis]|nr:helitron like n domain-containing protein [Citrus sinensis]